MSFHSTQSLLRQVRQNVHASLLHEIEEAVTRMFYAPRGRIWKYPGLMHRYATPDICAVLQRNSRHATSFSVSRRWSRCCLVLLRIGSRPIAAIFHRENHRLEVVRVPPSVPSSAFDGTIIDGFLGVDDQRVRFYVVDPLRYAGGWLGGVQTIGRKHQVVSPLFAAGSESEVGIVAIAMSQGICRLEDADKACLVYVRTPSRAYRAYVLCCDWNDAAAPDQTRTRAESQMVEDDPYED